MIDDLGEDEPGTEETRWEDIFTPEADAAPAPVTRRQLREREAAMSRRGGPRRPRRRLTWLWALLTALVVLVGAGTVVWVAFEKPIRQVLGWQDSIDFVGSGTGTVDVVVRQGDSGSAIATTLAKAGVTKTYSAFYRLLLAELPTPMFHPGTFRLAKGMSAKSALVAILDPANQVSSKIVIPEGTTVAGVLKRVAAVTSISLDQLQAAAADYASFGIPAEAPNLEGYLFPATYSFDPGTSAHDILQRMVTEMFRHLDKAGVPQADRHRVLTMAALIQKEGDSNDDFYKVSRVFANRLAAGMLLQSDATVSYGAGSTTISTTSAQRADAGNPYNTYLHPGLPIGPISNPGDAAIDAALHPADGPWLYFVLVNGKTGETVFSTTLAEHDAAVKQWRAWYAAHPDFDKKS